MRNMDFELPSNIKREIKILVESGAYSSKAEVIEEAFRIFLEFSPEKRMLIAKELYNKEYISLTRAAELAGLDIERFKEFLKSTGIKIKTYSGTKKEMEEGLKEL